MSGAEEIPNGHRWLISYAMAQSDNDTGGSFTQLWEGEYLGAEINTMLLDYESQEEC